MSIPRKHHYLPRWYLKRWAVEGSVCEFRRVGPQKKLRVNFTTPAGTAYAPHLYTLPDREPIEAAKLETDFLQVIDDRGARALAMAESNRFAGPHDKVGLSQFLLSLLHRTPDRIAHVRARLSAGTTKKTHKPELVDKVIRNSALFVFASLVESDLLLSRLFDLRVFTITLEPGGHSLMTSDRPLLMSNGLSHRDAFVILPIGPKKLLVLAEQEDLVTHISSHSSKKLSRAINDAIAVQASQIVIASDARQKRFIENRLQVPSAQKGRPVDPETGLIPWKI